jgi:hypothetical protein
MERSWRSIVRSFFINTTLIGGSLFFALIVGEIVLWAIEPEPEVVMVDDEILGRKTVKGWDESGFYNVKALEKADIVTLGDSMTQSLGVGMEETWPHLLGKLSGVSVYNMGFGGYGPVQYSALLPEVLRREPKTVLVGFFFGNDLYDAYDMAYHKDHWKSLRDPAASIEEKPLIDMDVRTSILAGAKQGTLSYYIYATRLWIRGHSRIYARLGDATRSLREKLNLAHTEKEKLEQVKELSSKDSDLAYVYDDEPEITTVLSPFYRYDAVNLEDSRTKEGWRITKNLFKEMKEKSVEQGAEVILISVPIKERIYLEHMRRVGKEIPEAFTGLEAKDKELEAEFEKFCKEENFRCFSLLPTMTDALGRKEVIFKTVLDGHPTAAGYAVMAESIHAYLNKQLVP